MSDRPDDSNQPDASPNTDGPAADAARNADSGTEPGWHRYALEPAFLPQPRTLDPQLSDPVLRAAVLDQAERRILRNRRDLHSHVRRVLMHHRQGEVTACFDALVDLFIVLGRGGRALRANLLARVADLLTPEQRDYLQRHLEGGLRADEPLPESAESLLTRGVSGSPVVLDAAPPDDLYAAAMACVERGDDATARLYLEQALEADPGHGLASMELLALYRRNGWESEFRRAWTRLSSRALAFAELWAKLDHDFQTMPRRAMPLIRQEPTVTSYKVSKEYHLLPTAAGAFYAVSGPQAEPLRQLLLALLRVPETSPGDVAALAEMAGLSGPDEVLELLHQAQTLGWIQGFRTPRRVPGAHIGAEMARLLKPLSAIGKGLLVDWNGFAFARHGIDDETAAILSALATDIAAVERRHAERLRRHLGVASQGWAAVDAWGASRIGAWPLFVGAHRFLLVLQGEPRLNQPEFVTLVWILVNRYSGVE